MLPKAGWHFLETRKKENKPYTAVAHVLVPNRITYDKWKLLHFVSLLGYLLTLFHLVFGEVLLVESPHLARARDTPATQVEPDVLGALQTSKSSALYRVLPAPIA